MKEEELFGKLCKYVCINVLSFEEYRSMGLEKFRAWVKENYRTIPKSELEVGKEYSGICRNANTATWDGNVFWYRRVKFGSEYKESINHYEDDNGFDLFVPVAEKEHGCEELL